MEKMMKVWLVTGFLSLLVAGSALAHCGVCGIPAEGKQEKRGRSEMPVFEKLTVEAKVKDGVREISYGQFTALRKSKEPYLLLDVLSKDSYRNGHIKGAISFPVDTINKETAAKAIPKGSHVVVHCGSFACGASTNAAKKLSELGYEVLDYKGGLKEWQEKGNRLVK